MSISKVKNYIIKKKLLIIGSLVALLLGYFIGNLFYSPPKEQLGSFLGGKYWGVLKTYARTADDIERISNKDYSRSWVYDRITRISTTKKDIDYIVYAYNSVKRRDDLKVDKLQYFNQSLRDDITTYVLVGENGNPEHSEHEELIELYYEITQGLQNIVYDFYPSQDENDISGIRNRQVIVDSGSGFFSDERWQELLTEMNQYVEESNFKERRKEKLR